MPEQCWVQKHPEYGSCCCQCKYRLRAIKHESDEQLGWACIAFALCGGEDIAYIGNFEHGMCELFTRKERE